MNKEKACGAVIFSKDKVLLTRNPDDSFFGIPKGRSESGESEEQTALREIKEEVGIEVTILPGFRELFHQQIKRPYGLTDTEFVVFCADTTTTELKVDPLETAEYRWITETELTTLTVHPEIPALIKKAYAFRRNI